jgi:hypothetical protein
MALRAAFPSGPLVDADGNLAAAWRGFFQSLYSRTGDAQGVSTPDISASVAVEAAARAAADTALTAAIVAERTAREAADTAAAGAGDPTKLPLAGGVLTGSVRGPLAGFATYIVGSTGGPTWTSGTAAPASTQPVGSLYSCTGGAVGATLYVSRGGGTWLPVAGV